MAGATDSQGNSRGDGSNPDIADTLMVSVETVKTHVSNLLAKLGARNRTQAVILAYESGLGVPGTDLG